jgi:hypothetical protein
VISQDKVDLGVFFQINVQLLILLPFFAKKSWWNVWQGWFGKILALFGNACIYFIRCEIKKS